MTRSEHTISRRHMLRCGLAGLATGAAACLLPACGAARPDNAVQINTPAKNWSRTDWKTLCVGRYLVDAPTEAVLNWVPIFKPVFESGMTDSRLRKIPGTPGDVKRLAAGKAQQLKTTPHETKGNLYIQSIPFGRDGMLVHGWEFKFSTRSTRGYLYIPLQAQGKSCIYTYDVRIFHDELEQQSLRDLLVFGSGFQPLTGGYPPVEPGFCFEDVMVTNIPESIGEWCGIGMEDPYAKDLTLSFETMTTEWQFSWVTAVKGRVEEKCRNIQEEGSCRKLRFGSHDLASMRGEEICLAGRTYDGKYTTYIFEWNNPGVPKDKFSPSRMATLFYSGVPLGYPAAPVPFSSDAEALEVWDRLVNSIRIRPTS